MFMEAFSIIAKTGKQTKGPLTEDKDIVHKYNGVLPSHYKEWNNAICSNMDGARNCHRKRQWHPTPVLLPGKSHGRRSLVGCSPGGHEELDTTERLHVHFSLSCIGEGNGNPLQCSCLENPRDRGAWWAAVYGVTQSRTWLQWLSSSSSSSSNRDCHTERSKSFREGEIPGDSLYVESKKKWYKWTYKTERLTDLENDLIVARRKAGGRDSLGVWDRQVHTAIFTVKEPWLDCTAHGALLSVMWQSGWEGSLGENGYMYIYGCSSETITALLMGYTPIQNKK